MTWVDGYRAHLAALRTAVETEPVVHAVQLAVVDREAAIAGRASDATSHAALGGAPYELARAAWIDRVVGHARIAATLDDPWAVRACAIELSGTLVGDTAEAMRAALVEVSPRAYQVRAAGVEAIGTFARLATSLVRLPSEKRPSVAGELRRDIVRCAEVVASHDQLALTRPRQRMRLPWHDLTPFARWLGELAPAAVANGTETDDAAGLLRDLETTVARWIRAIGDDRRARPVDAVPWEAATAGLPQLLAQCRAAIRTGAEPWLARQRRWIEPILEQHALQLIERSERATSPTAIDLISMHAAGCLAVEDTWWTALASATFAPLRAALVASYEPDMFTEAAIAPARDAAFALVGESDPWQLGWVADFVAQNLVPHTTDELDDFGTYEGEAGFDLLSTWRTWSGIRIALGAVGPEIPTARELTRHQRVTEVPDRRRVRVWDREVGLDDLDRARFAALRPAVPGFTAL